LLDTELPQQLWRTTHSTWFGAAGILLVLRLLPAADEAAAIHEQPQWRLPIGTWLSHLQPLQALQSTTPSLLTPKLTPSERLCTVPRYSFVPRLQLQPAPQRSRYVPPNVVLPHPALFPMPTQAATACLLPNSGAALRGKQAAAACPLARGIAGLRGRQVAALV
jgi:hypothetical protein